MVYLKYLLILIVIQFFSGFSSGLISQLAFGSMTINDVLLSKFMNATIEGIFIFLLFFNFTGVIRKNLFIKSITIYFISLVFWVSLDAVLLEVQEPLIHTLLYSFTMITIITLALVIAKRKQ